MKYKEKIAARWLAALVLMTLSAAAFAQQLLPRSELPRPPVAQRPAPI
jgi:hypothetical protein